MVKRSDLDTPVLRLSAKDYITLRQLTEGVLALGRTGAGKTSGVVAALADALLPYCGFLVLCAKKSERDRWIRRIKKVNRMQDVRFFGVEHPHRLNLLSYAFHQAGGRGSGNAENVTNLLMLLLEAKDRTRGVGGEQTFWYDSSKLLLTMAIILLGAAKEPISFEGIDQIISSAPDLPEDVDSERWKRGYLSRLVDKITSRNDFTAVQKNDAAKAIAYFLQKYPRIDSRTRSGIVATVESIIWPFQIGELNVLCDSETTLRPEDVFAGKIVLVDVPIKEYHAAGLFIQICWMILFFRAAEARNLEQFPAPAAFFADDGHYFMTSQNEAFQATARESRIITCLSTQSLDSVRSRFPSSTGKAEAESLLENMGLKIFCSTSHVPTQEWASKMCGEQWETRHNVNTSFANDGSVGASTNEQRRRLVEPLEFMQLKPPTPERRKVETIVFRAGAVFNATHTNHLRVDFPVE